MYATYIMRRTQIYLEPRQASRLADRAAAQGVTSSHLIREAVDAYLADSDTESAEIAHQKAAFRAAFGSIRRLPPGDEYVEAIRAADDERQRHLDERWSRD